MKKELELHLVLDETNMNSLYLISSFYKMANALVPSMNNEAAKFADEMVTVIEKIKKEE